MATPKKIVTYAHIFFLSSLFFLLLVFYCRHSCWAVVLFKQTIPIKSNVDGKGQIDKEDVEVNIIRRTYM